MAGYGTIPSVTVHPAPDEGGPGRVVSKFYGATRNPAAPNAVADGSFSFLDAIDIINPLQHIPIVSNIYRAVTGDESSPAAQLAGGMLMGGPLGGLLSLASAVFGELFSDSAATNAMAENSVKAAPSVKFAANNPALPAIMRG